MDKILVTSGKPLTGSVEMSGSKNAALPILCASLLSAGPATISNLPDLKDIDTMLSLLTTLGAKIERPNPSMAFIDMGICDQYEAPYQLVKTMRASVLVMGALLARTGKARVSLPGGCAIGSRPIDLHLKGLAKLGINIKLSGGYVNLTAAELKGSEIYLDFPSVGATENLIMAAVLAKGETVIAGAAKEPEVVDLANFLNQSGARIIGAGTDKIKITGVKELKAIDYKVIPDRIEAGTFMVAAAITKGDIYIKGVVPEHLMAVITKLQEAGVEVTSGKEGLKVSAPNDLRPVNIRTLPYPGFPTDMQAQLMTLMSVTEGLSLIEETIFENRFMHVAELARMGAKIKIEGHGALVSGVKSLSAAPVMATDLRASAALVLAALTAKGTTEISRVYHLDRGYEKLEEKLRGLGAEIERIKGQ
ncbi:MAG: UDP-N-acetylglucosamine 1-carboxyvinyltransferase [bacterium]